VAGFSREPVFFELFDDIHLVKNGENLNVLLLEVTDLTGRTRVGAQPTDGVLKRSRDSESLRGKFLKTGGELVW